MNAASPFALVVAVTSLLFFLTGVRVVRAFGRESYEKERFETTFHLALEMSSSPRYRLIQSILVNNQDIVRKEHEALPRENSHAEEDSDAFIRGAFYYEGGTHNA